MTWADVSLATLIGAMEISDTVDSRVLSVIKGLEGGTWELFTQETEWPGTWCVGSINRILRKCCRDVSKRARHATIWVLHLRTWHYFREIRSDSWHEEATTIKWSFLTMFIIPNSFVLTSVSSYSFIRFGKLQSSLNFPDYSSLPVESGLML